MRLVALLSCQGLPLLFTDSHRYVGQDVSVSQRLLANLVLLQVTLFQQAALRLCHAANQLQLLVPGLWVLLAQSLCISHLLTGCVVWCPTLLVQFTLHPPYGSPIC